MIIDTSALLAVLFGEKGAETYAQAISEAEDCRISATTFVEVSIVVESQTGDAGSRQWDAFCRTASISIEPVTEEHAHAARQAWSEFGKGRHAAGLNFGDCFSYAFAKVSGEPLLFKGQDFRKTSVPAVL
jgi:ribonuclease VapC